MDYVYRLRAIGDTIFAIGLFAFVWFVFSLDSRKKVPLDEKPRGEKINKERKELQEV